MRAKRVDNTLNEFERKDDLRKELGIGRDVAMIAKLETSGFDFNPEFPESDLHYAINSNYLDVVQWLLEKYKKKLINFSYDDGGVICVMNGFIDILDFLIEFKYISKKKVGYYAILAADHNKLDMFKYLISLRDLDETEIYSIFVSACHGNSMILVDYIIDNFDISITLINAGFYAAVVNNNVMLVRYLVEEHEADVYLLNNRALVAAKEHNNQKIVNYLEKKMDE